MHLSDDESTGSAEEKESDDEEEEEEEEQSISDLETAHPSAVAPSAADGTATAPPQFSVRDAMDLMDSEVASHPALARDFVPLPDDDSSAEDSGDDAAGRQHRLHPPRSTPTDTAPADLDPALNLLSSFSRSVESQGADPGPVSNLLGMMGLRMTPEKKGGKRKL
jgi:hypothetical protein